MQPGKAPPPVLHCCRVLSWNVTVYIYLNTKTQLHWEAYIVSACREIPAVYGTRRVITVFTTARHWSLAWARLIQCTLSVAVSVGSILVLPSHLRLCPANGLFSFRFSNFYMYFSSSHACYMPVHLVLLCWSTRILSDQRYKLWSWPLWKWRVMGHLLWHCRDQLSQLCTNISVEQCCITIRGRIQKFPDWPPGARTSYGTVLCH